MANGGWWTGVQQGQLRKKLRDPWVCSIVGGLLATLSLLLWQGSPYLFDWDELIYASLAREMVRSGDWLQLRIGGEPFLEKPPLFFWLQAASFQVFGIQEAAARLPSAVAGGILTGGIVAMGSRIWHLRLACWWGILLNTALLPLLVAKTGLIDPVFNVGMLAGLAGLFCHEQARRRRQPGWLHLVGAAVALGLAVLAKGPLGLGLPLLIWGLYKSWHRDLWPPLRDVAVFGLVTAGVAGSWFGFESLREGSTFAADFMRYQWRIASTDDGRGGPVYFHLLAYILGCLPFAALSVRQMVGQVVGQVRRMRTQPFSTGGDPQADRVSLEASRWDDLVLVAFGVVLVLFSLGIQTKLVHYTSMLYPLGAYLGARRLDSLLQGQGQLSYAERFWILLSGGIWALILLLLPWVGGFPLPILTWVQDPLARAYLEAGVSWPPITYAAGLVLLLSLGLWRALVPWRIWVKADKAPHPSQRRGQIAWGILVVGVWASTQLTWHGVGSRVLEHSQGGAIRLLREVEAEPLGSPEITTAFYGFRSFMPFFYGPSLTPNPETLGELEQLITSGQTQSVITWAIFEEDVRGVVQGLAPGSQRVGAYVRLNLAAEEASEGSE
ncbi:MAG: phospholipid carrier-dependent glycosyltransferase [Synechococcaceae cyanobacterium SM2_3_2]|nr:phospholipid carrier-dependent glycosyltransferase [Synechococcaceae cyanobacterium SM2_3_2]